MKPFIRYILSFYLALLTLSSNAQFIWQTTLGTNGTDLAKDFIPTSDGNYLSLGFSSGDSVGAYLSKIDTMGTILWERWYAFNNIWGAHSLIEMPNTDIVIANNILSGNTPISGVLIKLNAVGDTIFSVKDSSTLGVSVSNLTLLTNGILLAVTGHNNSKSIVKLDSSFSVTSRIDNITKPIKGLEVINNTIYVLLNDSINNLLMINNNLTQIDTVTLPVVFPLHLRANFNADKLIVYGRDFSFWQNPHKMVYVDLFGNIAQVCDSVFVPNVLTGNVVDDFKPIDNQDHLLFASQKYTTQFGEDIQLFFTDKCGEVQFDTILPRWSFTEELNEQAKRVIVDNDGNYLVYGRATEGPLGGDDIFLFKYKKVQLSTAINDANESLSTSNHAIIYPNPFHHQFIIDGMEQNVTISIVDVTGRIIHQFHSTSSSYMVNSSSWANGLYIVTIKGLTTTTVHKVVKQ